MVGVATSSRSPDVTLPLEGRVAKLGPQGRSEAREGVNSASHQLVEVI